MNTKVIAGALMVAFGLIAVVTAYLRLHSMSGPARSIPAGFADNAFMMLCMGVAVGLVGAVIVVFFALRERS